MRVIVINIVLLLLILVHGEPFENIPSRSFLHTVVDKPGTKHSAVSSATVNSTVQVDLISNDCADVPHPVVGDVLRALSTNLFASVDQNPLIRQLFSFRIVRTILLLYLCCSSPFKTCVEPAVVHCLISSTTAARRECGTASVCSRLPILTNR